VWSLSNLYKNFQRLQPRVLHVGEIQIYSCDVGPNLRFWWATEHSQWQKNIKRFSMRNRKTHA
jgi:hypothetical protein